MEDGEVGAKEKLQVSDHNVQRKKLQREVGLGLKLFLFKRNTSCASGVERLLSHLLLMNGERGPGMFGDGSSIGREVF